MENIEGPFGSYPHGTHGAVLNAAVRIENIPLNRVEHFTLGEHNTIKVGDKLVGRYKWFEDITQPLFIWLDSEYRAYAQHRFVSDNGVLIPKFRLTLCVQGSPAFEIDGPNATPELHEFLMGMLTNWTLDPCYDIHQEAGAFFQGGAHAPDGQFFMIEFWKPKGIQAFMDYLNNNYRVKQEA